MSMEISWVMRTGDQVIVIAEDDDSYSPAKEPAAVRDPEDSCPPCVSRRVPERVLFCGWRRDMHDMIAVLDAFVYPGSELWLYNEVGLGPLPLKKLVLALPRDRCRHLQQSASMAMHAMPCGKPDE
jgi:hypothetical protein